MKNFKLFLLPLILFFSVNKVNGQKTRIGTLDKKLNEISGLTFINDSIMVGHNDSGDGSKLYFMNVNGELKHECLVSNAKNIDWEDITYDGAKYLYIADFGNNDNNRKDLVIYKVEAEKALKNIQVEAKVITFNYVEQKTFPPSNDSLFYDAEGLAYFNDELYIFTKCRTKPYTGISFCYKVPTKEGNYNLTKSFEVTLGKDGWWKDSNTALEVHNGVFYVLTYNRLITMRLTEKGFEQINEYLMEPISQFEAVAINSKGDIYLADEENSLLGGGNIYQVKFSKNKK
jgi:hypothetical protein